MGIYPIYKLYLFFFFQIKTVPSLRPVPDTSVQWRWIGGVGAFGNRSTRNAREYLTIDNFIYLYFLAHDFSVELSFSFESNYASSMQNCICLSIFIFLHNNLV